MPSEGKVEVHSDRTGVTRSWQLPEGGTIAHLNRNETISLHREVFTERAYAPAGMQLRPAATVLDIGANIGMFALFAERTWSPALIVAVEPVPELVEVLRANLAGSHAVVVQAACAEQDGQCRLTYYPAATILSGRHADPERDLRTLKQHARRTLGDRVADADLDELLRARVAGVELDCRKLSLASLVREHRIGRIDLLKIDVEGDELAVLQGSSDNLAMVANVVVEVSAGVEEDRITRLLKHAGMIVTRYQSPQYQGSDLWMLWAHR